MCPILSRPVLLVVVALAAIASPAGHAAGLFSEQDVDARFKARIMKEKAKQNQLAATANANSFNFTHAGNAGDGSSACGSQNIGNVDTGGRPGTAPREVFVFAPNAINLVSGPACK